MIMEAPWPPSPKAQSDPSRTSATADSFPRSSRQSVKPGGVLNASNTRTKNNTPGQHIPSDIPCHLVYSIREDRGMIVLHIFNSLLPVNAPLIYPCIIHLQHGRREGDGFFFWLSVSIHVFINILLGSPEEVDSVFWKYAGRDVLDYKYIL